MKIDFILEFTFDHQNKAIMKSLILSFLFIFFMGFGMICRAQDYNDLGRTKAEEFKILKYNGYKITKIHSNDMQEEMYLAKRTSQSQYDNIITIDKSTDKVIGVIWDFDTKNLELIKSLLSDMNPTDNTASRLENKKGMALMTPDPFHDGFEMVVWRKKS